MTHMSNTPWAKCLALATLALTCSMAQAHTGHEVTGMMEGLTHPLGLDHLLAMVAVGVWSVRVLPAHKIWKGPATFLLALLLSATVGASGVTLPYLEHAIALSVVLLGVMLIFAQYQMPVAAGLSLVALAASLHGLAHGAEMPASDFAGYATGFLLTTTVLHVVGVLLASSIQHFMAQRAKTLTATLGMLIGGSGLYLLQQL